MENLHKLIDVLADELFKPEARRLQNRVVELDKQNGEIRRAREYGFQWKGHIFRVAGSPTKVLRVPALEFALRKEGDDLLRDMQAVEDDKQLVKQVMALLLKPCIDLQNIRDALPESLVELSSQLSGMTRLREPAWTLTDERHLRQYAKMLDKIDFYAATRMMY